MKRILPLLIVFLAGCATAPKQVEVAVPQDHFSEIEAAPVPLVMNDRVQDWLNYFQGSGRERFGRYLSRSERYIPMMKRILRQYGLPDDLVYLAMIESGFNPHAYSRARATGTWQFIYRTGVRYGLRVDNWIDERRDPEKSTVAAAKYLKDLYDQFNDWYLAAAGYNAGEGKIHRAIKRYRTEDFWTMARQRYLKRETKEYVPKMIAAALISKDPEKYGFDVTYEEPVKFATVTIDTPTDLRTAAQCAGISYEEIKALNPELLHWVTPPHYPDYQLKVPADTAEEFKIRFAALSPEERIAERIYESKGKETIRQVATREGMPVKWLAVLNGLSTEARLSRRQVVLIPHAAPEGERYRERSYERRRVRADHVRKGRAVVPQAVQKAVVATAEAAEPFTSYTLQAGDTLWDIAQQHHVTVRELKRWNRVTAHRRLRPGDSIKIRTTSPAL